MALLAGIIVLIVAVVGLIVLAFVYVGGRDDADWFSYDNGYSGLLAVIYDIGYNSIAAGKARRKANLEKNKAKLESRGK